MHGARLATRGTESNLRNAGTTIGTPDIEPVVEWLCQGARPAADGPEGLRLFCERAVKAGLRLDRVAVFVRPLHPQVVARSFYWQRGKPRIEVDAQDASFLGSAEQLASPIHIVTRTRREIRTKLAADAALDYPIQHELRADGYTDYLIMPLEFVDGEVHVASFATRAPGGFTPAETDALHRVQPAFTRVVEIFGLASKTVNILDAYLGRLAGERVLAGRIRRGDVEAIHAVIWFCDLRESTELAESLGAPAYLALLNRYFERMLAPLGSRGGEILSFVGDAAVAIFPVRDSVRDAAARAVEAARASIASMAAFNAERSAAGEPELRSGIGLHIGDLLYGNIGTPARIAFTVTGPAANAAARIEAMCKAHGVCLLVSADVATHVEAPWRSIGVHALRGVGTPLELYTLPEATAG